MRPIDATALHKKIAFMQEQYKAERSNVKARMCRKIMAIIEFMPEIKVEPPVRHGRWVRVNSIHGLNAFKCSECNGYSGRITAFCSTCGAKMDGGNGNETD